MEVPASHLALADRLISGVLLNIGWIVMLIGLEPVGARLNQRYAYLQRSWCRISNASRPCIIDHGYSLAAVKS